MTKEEYKAKKLEELHREFPSVWDGKVVQEFLTSFLSQMIDELTDDIRTFEAQTVLTEEQKVSGKAPMLDYIFKELSRMIASEMIREGAIVYDREKDNLGEIISARCKCFIDKP